MTCQRADFWGLLMRTGQIKCLLLMMFLFSSLAWAQKEARELAFSYWGVNVEPSVVQRAFSKEAVRDFLRTMDFSGTTEVGMNELKWSKVREEYEGIGVYGTVGALKWADVDADGVYELLVTMDYSGRAFYNNLYIVKQIAGGYRRQWISIASTETFKESLGASTVIYDLDHDGMLELILPIRIGAYRGASLTPVWTSIFKWEKYGYVEADERFKGFYEESLPRIEKTIAELSRGKSEEAQNLDELLTTIWVIRDKIIRLLGIDPQAGLQRAIRWTKSANWVVRENAAVVFSEIPGEEAARFLGELAADPYVSVRIYAQSVLKKRGEKARE